MVVRMPLDAADDSDRKLRDHDLSSGRGVDDVHSADAILISDVGDAVAVLGQLELIDIPFLPAEDRLRTIRQMHAHELREFRAFIAEEVDVVAVAAESPVPKRDRRA